VVGSASGGGNLISGNINNGVDLTDSSSSTQIKANLIGTDAAGTGPIHNFVGIGVGNTVSATLIGGVISADRNVVSGNTSQGIILLNAASGTQIQGNYVGIDVNGTTPLQNNAGIEVGSTITSATIGGGAGAGNVISGNAQGGVVVGGSGINVLGNRIGLNAAGTAVGNTFGVFVTNANNTIGNTTGTGNVISGNTVGIRVTTNTATGNSIVGNRIGTAPDGVSARANGTDVEITASAANNSIGSTVRVTVGGPCTGGRNVIAGINGTAITLNAASSTTIVGNHIGIDVSGGSALGGAATGIDVNNSPTTTIGGSTSTAERNLIGNFIQNGILIQAPGSTTARVQGKYIGVTVDGTAAFSNGNGIAVTQVTGALIGGTSSTAGNLIAANTLHGIVFTNGSTNAQIFGNEIGRSGLGNGQRGVSSTATGAGNHSIGGINPGEGNRIKFNGGFGVSITGAANTGKVVHRSSISANVGGGIFTAVAVTAPNLTGVGTAPNHDVTFTLTTGGFVEIFKADAAGQGLTFLTSSGSLGVGGPYSVSLGAAVTDGTNNTSAFSNTVVVP
jgi:hypothetical protein